MKRIFIIISTVLFITVLAFIYISGRETVNNESNEVNVEKDSGTKNSANEVSVKEDSVETNNSEKVEYFMYGSKTKMVLAYQAEKDGETIKEYIPESETLENYGLMVAVREQPSFSDPKQFRDEFVKNLKETTHKDSDVAFGDRTDENAYYIYFAIIDPNDKFVEHNVFKYMKNSEKDGIISYQWVLRDFMDDRKTSLDIKGGALDSFEDVNKSIYYMETTMVK